MRSIGILASLALLLGTASAQSSRPAPVLVELFTSEGCSSCPPADKLLADLQQKQPVKEAEIILLGFHVDYWNYIGWTDRFSSPQFTKRQESYAARSYERSVYTPQIIVDGVVRQFDPYALKDDIQRSAKQPKPVTLELRSSSPGNITITALGNESSEIFLAITEDDLRNDVKRGENGGRVLVHWGVVRRFLPLGQLKNNEPKQISLARESDWRKDQLHVVAFAQDTKSGKVTGVTSVRAPTLE